VVHVEEVFGIVFRLDLLQPRKIHAVGRGDRIILLIVTKVVDVTVGTNELIHRAIGIPRPRDAATVVFRLHPLGQHEQVVTLRAVWECGVRDADARNRAMEVLEQ